MDTYLAHLLWIEVSLPGDLNKRSKLLWVALKQLLERLHLRLCGCCVAGTTLLWRPLLARLLLLLRRLWRTRSITAIVSLLLLLLLLLRSGCRLHSLKLLLLQQSRAILCLLSGRHLIRRNICPTVVGLLLLPSIVATILLHGAQPFE